MKQTSKFIIFLLLLSSISIKALSSSLYSEHGFAKAPEEYTSVQDDTLQNIADHMLGLPNQWRLLWRLNPHVKDPENIPLGTKIYFHDNDFTKKNTDSSKKNLEKINFQVDRSPFRPEKNKKHIPEQFWQKMILKNENQFKPIPVELIGLEDIKSKRDESYQDVKYYSSDFITVTIPGFIFSEDQEKLGVVLGGQTGESLSSLKQNIVGVIKGDLVFNKIYSVIRYIKEIFNQNGEPIGKLYHFVGNIRPSVALNDGLFFQASVETIRTAVKSGDLVVPFLSTKREVLKPKELIQDHTINASIVSFEEEDQEIAGLGDFVFLDKGEDASINIGQIYQINQTVLFNENETGQENPESYLNAGFLKILDVTPKGSVGIVVSNVREIMTGDSVGS